MFGFTLRVFFLFHRFDFYEARKKVRTKHFNETTIYCLNHIIRMRSNETNTFGIWSGCFYFVVAFNNEGYFSSIFGHRSVGHTAIQVHFKRLNRKYHRNHSTFYDRRIQWMNIVWEWFRFEWNFVFWLKEYFMTFFLLNILIFFIVIIHGIFDCCSLSFDKFLLEKENIRNVFGHWFKNYYLAFIALIRQFKYKKIKQSIQVWSIIGKISQHTICLRDDKCIRKTYQQVHLDCHYQ